jgi:hypothetical protein
VPGSHQLQRDEPDACPAHRRRKARDLQAQKFEGGGSSSADVYCVVSASLPLPRWKYLLESAAVSAPYAAESQVIVAFCNQGGHGWGTRFR